MVKNADKTNEQFMNEMIEVHGSEDWYRILYEENPSIYFSMDALGKIISINDFGAKQLGYDVKELVGQSIIKVIYKDDINSLLQQVAECLKEPGHIVSREFRKVRRDGNIIWVKESARALLVNGQNRILVVCEDITRLKQMEEELRKTRDELETRVMERTTELEHINSALQVEITQHRLTEQRLWLLSEAVEEAANGIQIIDLEGRILFSNKAVEVIYGFSREEYGGKHVSEMNVDPGFAGSVIIPAIKKTGRWRGELMVWHKDGRAFPIFLTASLIKDKKGEPMAMVGIITDITKRKQAEERIRFQTTVLSQVNDAVVAVDNEHRIIYWNKGAEQLYDFKSGEVLGKTLEEVTRYRWLRPEDEKAAYGSLAATGSWRGELIHIKKSGEEMYIEASISVLNDEKGKAIGFITVMRNITERKRTEKLLRESEERYRNLIELTVDIIYLSDREGNQLFMNDAGYRMLEAVPEEIIGQTWQKWIHPDDRERTYQKFREMLERNIDLFDFENRLVSKSGRVIHVLQNVRLLRDENGDIIGTQGIARDITERKRAEEERERWTAELARSNAELEQFAYVVSHDLQEPLRMVASFAQLLAKRYRGKLDKNADEFIDYIVDGATRMQRMINDLLEYSRVGTRGKPFEPTSIETAFDQAVVNLKVAIEECGAVVTHDPLPVVIADATQMVQLFQNLLSNAIKFRSKEPPRIHTCAKREENEWVFLVQDNGIGIAPEFLSRIFQIFQRQHSRSEYPGTGIGLAICKKIVERHGGRIWVRSVQGRGSTFYFTIPDKRDGLL